MYDKNLQEKLEKGRVTKNYSEPLVQWIRALYPEGLSETEIYQL